MSRNNFLLLLIFVLAFSLRFFFLGEIPEGLYSDEAAYGYNAFSILKTGKDEYGARFPLAFKSFGDYKAPLYFYFMVPFVWLFGLSEFSVRASSSTLGLLSIICTYFIVRHISKRESAALLSSFLLSISPMSLQFTRIGHENNLVVMLIALGILFFVFSFIKRYFIIPFFITMALSIYTYHDAKVLAPMLIIALFIAYRERIRMNIKEVILGSCVFVFLLIPLIKLFGNESVWTRPKNTVFLSDAGTLLSINDDIGEDRSLNFSYPTVFHNKVITFAKKFTENYFLHFSPDFLMFSGDPVKIYSTDEIGIIYIAEFIFLIFGLYYIYINKIPHRWTLVLLLLLAPFPAALTKYVPSASRTFSMVLPLSIIPSFGFILIIDYLRTFAWKKIIFLLISVIFFLNIAYYLHYYYFNTRIHYVKDWHYGMKDVISKVKEMQSRYTTVWFSRNTWGYMYPLFYLQYPPDRYQQVNHLGVLNEYGFGWVDKFDKYIFADFPNDMVNKKDTLFVGIPSDFHNIQKPLTAIYYPNGEPAFYIADNNSL